MGNMKRYQMDLEEELAFEAITPTTKRVTVTTAYTYTYEVSFDFDIKDDDQLTSLMANGSPVDEGPSGEDQKIVDLASTRARTFIFKG